MKLLSIRTSLDKNSMMSAFRVSATGVECIFHHATNNSLYSCSYVEIKRTILYAHFFSYLKYGSPEYTRSIK